MKTVVGLFETLDDAQSTMNELARLGLSAQNIGLLSSTRSTGGGSRGNMSLLDLPGLGQVAANGPMLKLLDAPSAQKSPDGALGALVKMGVAQADASRLVDGVKRGGTLEALVVDDDKEAEARAIMNRRAGNGAWREPAADDIVVPVIREEMVVGKREIDAGGVRITTHVTVRPVEKSIAVHEERVDVERRAVDRPVGELDTAFRDSSVEMKASFEEPYITKRAHVVEEIRIHKGRTEHVEKIHDTLRQTEVDVTELPTERRTGAPFDESSPAYAYGAELARRMPGRDWASAESEAKSMWEGKNPGTWDQYRAAIRVGFHNLKH